jgi:thioredoxin-dependent peroxiredoxin
MSLRLGDTAPDFSADTTAGPIDFHRWAGESWVVLTRSSSPTPIAWPRR